MKRARFPILLVFLALVMACAIGQTQNPTISWHLDIQNWTSHQKANFFMETWMAENAGYKAMNTIPNKSEALIKLLKAKQKVIELARLPIRTYASIVNSGGVIDTTTEQQITGWLRQLQLQALQGGN